MSDRIGLLSSCARRRYAYRIRSRSIPRRWRACRAESRARGWAHILPRVDLERRRNPVTEHTVGSQEEWQAARDELLTKEKELTRLGDELARQRRELPWVPIEKQYRFETDEGTKSLAELFDGRSQLLVYHFMFGPEYEAGCTVCSSIADTLSPQVVHLRARDVTLICASHAPLEKLQAYKRRMGWGFDWVSTRDGDFGFDFGFSRSPAEAQALADTPSP